MARPKKIIDEDLISELSGLHCSIEEISRVVGVSPATLKRNYKPAINRGTDWLKTSLKRKQFKTAMQGNIKMLIWLGIQYLSQSNKKRRDDKLELTIIKKVVDFTKNSKKSDVRMLRQAQQPKKKKDVSRKSKVGSKD